MISSFPFKQSILFIKILIQFKKLERVLESCRRGMNTKNNTSHSSLNKNYPENLK